MSATSIETLDGRYFDVFNCKQDDIRVEEIAHALAHQCRFSGYTSRHYSVAEHSVYVARIVRKRWLEDTTVMPGAEARVVVRQALLHDATEAYLVDLPRPIKYAMPLYKEIEAKLWVTIAEKFNVPVEMHPWVKEADYRICGTEKLALLSPGFGPNGEWVEYFKRYPPYTGEDDIVDVYEPTHSMVRRRFLDFYQTVRE